MSRQVLEKELNAKEPELEALLLRGQEMLLAKHFAADQLQTLGQELTSLWDSVNAASRARLQQLTAMLEYEQVSHSQSTSQSAPVSGQELTSLEYEQVRSFLLNVIYSLRRAPEFVP